MRGNVIDFAQARRISASTFGEWTRRLEPAVGDLLLAREAPVGPVVRIPDALNVAPGQRTVLLRPDAGRCDSRFLYLVISSPQVQADLGRMAEGSTVRHLNVVDIRRLLLCGVPPLDEQRAIAEVLGALDDKIAANAHEARVAEGYLTSLFEATGIDRDAGARDSAARTSQFFDLNPRRSAPSGDAPVYLEMASLPTRSFAVSNWTRREPKGGTRFMNGDTVMARITPCLENGKVAYVDFMGAGEVGLGSTEYIVIRSRAEAGIPPEASYFLARSPRFQANAVQNMVGSSGRQRVAASDLALFPLRAPEPAVLAEFGAAAAPIFGRVRSAVDESRQLAATRDALLPALMSGRLTVRDAERVVADAT